MHGLKFGGLFKAKKMETDGVQKAGFMERFVQLTRSSAFQRLVPFIALAALILVYSILAPLRFPTAMNAQYILIQSVAIMVVAFGSTLIVISGSIDLSVGSVAALSGMSGALVANQHGAVFGILAAVATGAIAGLINGAGLAYLKIPSFIMTLGMLSIARGITLVISETQPVTVPETWNWMGDTPGIYLVALFVLMACVLLYQRTSFGRYIAALGGSERVAAMAGVPVKKIKLLVFTLGGVCAAMGGLVLSARVGAATPTAGTGMELVVIAAVVLGGTPLTGGVGSLVNTAVGALIITILLNGLVILGVGAELQIIAQGVVLVVAVLISLDRRKIGIIK
jgi:ribose/xylose/arabinose/galactoside ABC-type transport system permease subunit